MKVALIVYHRNAELIYPMDWIFKCRTTINEQTYKDFDIFEMEYGAGNFRIFENSNEFYQINLPTFVDAMNYLLDKVFSLGYDYCANVNIDDYYALNRIEKQLKYMEEGIDIISSNFSLVSHYQITHTHQFDKMDIETELNKGNNILCHPVICYSKKFWEQNRYVPSEIPEEDLLLWKRAIRNGNSFKISEHVLCFHRLHSESVCQSLNR